MNEDLKPCYDIESLWMNDINIPGELIKSHHKDYESLNRLIDFKNQIYLFSDPLRVRPEYIIDINKDIGIERKTELTPKALAIVNHLKPIVLPYLPERVKVYVEDLGLYIGFLYFRSDEAPDDMVPIKAFFKVVRDPVLNFIPVEWGEFNDYKEEIENELDSNTKQTENR